MSSKLHSPVLQDDERFALMKVRVKFSMFLGWVHSSMVESSKWNGKSSLGDKSFDVHSDKSFRAHAWHSLGTKCFPSKSRSRSVIDRSNILLRITFWDDANAHSLDYSSSLPWFCVNKTALCIARRLFWLSTSDLRQYIDVNIFKRLCAENWWKSHGWKLIWHCCVKVIGQIDKTLCAS